MHSADGTACPIGALSKPRIDVQTPKGNGSNHQSHSSVPNAWDPVLSLHHVYAANRRAPE